jgi:DNA-binding response OmpR family regulator
MIAVGVFPISGGFVTANLLAVDDSKTMRKVIEHTFAGEDYRMVLADSPADAMAKLRAEKPAVALVDALLGGASGYDLCQHIKAEAPQVGVIVLSSKQHPYDRVKGSAVGADDYLDKPYDSQALIDKVAALVQKLANAPAARPAAAPVARPAPVVTVTTQPGTAPAAAPAAAARPHTTTMSFGSPSAARPVAAQVSPAVVPAGSQVPVRPTPIAAPVAPVAQQAPAQQAPTQQAPTQQAPMQQAPMQQAPAPAHPRVVVEPPLAAAPQVTDLIDASMETKLVALGLTKDQIAGVVALSREVVEQVVWEVVPVLAETMIREEIKRLTAE